MDATRLHAYKTELLGLVGENKIEQTLERLRQTIPASATDKVKTLVLLTANFRAIQDARVKGTQAFEAIFTKESEFRNSLLGFIEVLSAEDFDIAPAGSDPAPVKINKTGSVLYAIPSQMQVQKEKKCVVRLSFDEKYLFDNYFSGSDTHIKSIRRIGDRMEVELVDPNEERVFSVRAISNTLQKVEKEDYTEWLFFVKPLVEGTFDLWLKVTVVMKAEDGLTDRKEIVLQEKIEVVTYATEEAGVEMRHSGLLFTFGGGALAGPGGDDGGGGSAAPGAAEVLKGFLKSAAGKITAGAGALVVAGGLWYSGIIGGQAGDDGTAHEGATPATAAAQFTSYAIKQPFENVDVPEYTFLINPNRDTVVNLPSGTSLNIPASSLVDENGHPVTDLVEIRVTEFKKAHEIITSGIPMRVLGSDNKAQWMQTAGMFEVQGYCNGKKVAIAAGKSIHVNLISDVDGAYDFWIFDPQSGNWISKGATASPERVNIAPPAALQKEIQELKSLTRERPAKPRVYNRYSYRKGEINADCCPELQKQVTVLTYAGSDPAKALENNTWVASETWKNTWAQKKISRIAGKPGHYLFEWHGDTTFKTEVKVAGPDDFKLAQARYDSLNKIFERNMVSLKQKEAIAGEQAQFRRSIAVQGFGLYNYDILWKKADAVPVLADFDFGPEYEAMKELVTVYIVTGDDRVVVSLPYREWHTFRYSPSSDNKMLAVLPGNKMAVYTEKDFERDKNAILKAKGQQFRFKMRVQERPADSLTDVQSALKAADDVL